MAGQPEHQEIPERQQLLNLITQMQSRIEELTIQTHRHNETMRAAEASAAEALATQRRQEEQLALKNAEIETARSQAAEANARAAQASGQAFPPNNVGGPQNTSRPRQILPTPPTFTGTRKDYSAWKESIVNKLAIDGDAIGGQQAQIAMVYASTSGAAATNISHFVRRLRSNANATVDMLSEYMDGLYLDADTDGRLMAELREPQGKQSFPTFIPVFEERLARIDGLDWPDKVKISALISVMDPALADVLALTFKRLDNYNTYRDEAVRLSQMPGTLNLGRGLNPNYNSNHDLNRRHPDEMEWAASYSAQSSRGSGPAAATAANNRPNPSAFPTNDQLRGRRARWVTTEEFERRRAARVCFRCGRPGCGTDRCPLKPAVNPNSRRATTPRANIAQANDAVPVIEVREARVEDISEADYVSEN